MTTLPANPLPPAVPTPDRLQNMDAEIEATYRQTAHRENTSAYVARVEATVNEIIRSKEESAKLDEPHPEPATINEAIPQLFV